MNEERKAILDMLAEGKITAEEAEQLIAALERDRPPVPARPGSRPRDQAQYLRLEVDSIEDFEPSRVNIRVPLQLLRAGVRLAALIPPRALARANEQLNRSGIPLDLTQLKPDQLEELIEQLTEVSLEVDGTESQVHIFCE